MSQTLKSMCRLPFHPSLRGSCVVLLSAILLIGPSTARADQAREFILSCSYGALAGTLVGAATLAFSDKPGDNLNKVARGASLGLYAGILLGLYVAYGVPSENDPASMDDSAALDRNFAPPELPRLQIAPLIGDNGLEGAAASFDIVRF